MPRTSCGAKTARANDCAWQGSRKTQAGNAANRPLPLKLESGQHKDQANEIFVDLIENVTALFDAEVRSCCGWCSASVLTLPVQGTMVNMQIDGQLMMRSYLHGEPTLEMAFNHDMSVRNRGDGAALSSHSSGE